MQQQKNCIFQLLLLSVILSYAICDNSFGMRLTTETLKAKENTQYRFHYFVKDDATGDFKTQEETKEGDSVHGSYTLAEPNGDLRTVTYKAGPGRGFEAMINVHPSGSSVKQTTEDTTLSTTAFVSNVTPTKEEKTEKGNTAESTVEHFPGGFIMDILRKPQPYIKTEMGMTFSLNPNYATEPVTKTVDATSSTATDKAQTTLETTTPTFATLNLQNLKRSKPENSAENVKIIQDPIMKEIDEAENSMPKLPEFIMSDNKTHFKFHKNPEEVFLNERITQIARQLAETSLRREYEERKLGHFIPISVTSVEPITSSHLSKSFKFTGNGRTKFRPSPKSPLQVLTQLNLIPHYIYKETALTRFVPASQQSPVVQSGMPTQNPEQWDQKTYETITNVPEIMKINKSETQIKEINLILKGKETKYAPKYDTSDDEPVSVMPLHVPTFFQFFTPYVMPAQGNYATQSKPETQLYITPENLNSGTVQIPLNESATARDHIMITNPNNISLS